MKFKGMLPASRVTVGGLAVKLDPYYFQQFAVREDLPVVHGIIGVFSKHHVYLTVHDGMTFYTKVEDHLPGLQVVVEADRIISYIRL
ncbi:MAG: hypothetical protein Q6361_07780 [Candidatus Hermodarchaeota archaeon]|nr:hypothetical protein [Candidatus Hermodarchaeota archaeon]